MVGPSFISLECPSHPSTIHVCALWHHPCCLLRALVAHHCPWIREDRRTNRKSLAGRRRGTILIHRLHPTTERVAQLEGI